MNFNFNLREYVRVVCRHFEEHGKGLYEIRAVPRFVHWHTTMHAAYTCIYGQ